MTSPVVYNPQRDAWKAIRGFHYQVELTVIRWLELQADTILYCECGEDIDHVRQLVLAGGLLRRKASMIRRLPLACAIGGTHDQRVFRGVLAFAGTVPDAAGNS